MTKARCFKVWAQQGCVAITFLLLAGCSVLPESEPQTVYALPEAQIEDQSASVSPKHRWSLRMQTPYSNRMLNSSRIVVQPDNSEISVYKGVRWSDAAPIVLRNRLVNAFRAQTAFASVSNDSTHMMSDLEFGGDLNHFQVKYLDGVPTVHIQLDAFLLDPSNSHIIASQRFSVKQPAEGKEVPDVVLTFGEAADRLAVDVVAWVLEHSPVEVKGR